MAGGTAVIDLTADDSQPEEDAELGALVARVIAGALHPGLSEAQSAQLWGLPVTQLRLLASGVVTLADVALAHVVRAQQELDAEDAPRLAAVCAALQALQAEEALADAAAAAAEDAELWETHAQLQKAAPPPPPPLAAPRVVQCHARAAASARFEWSGARGAWVSDVAHPSDSMTFAFISDTHGVHSCLDVYTAAHAAVREADVLCVTGDCFDHDHCPSRVDALPGVQRDFLAWLAAQPQRYKFVISGNHDEALAIHGEAAALQGGAAPEAGDVPRAQLASVGSPALYLQDEAAIIPCANGGEVIIYGLPWHPEMQVTLPNGARTVHRCDGCFEYDEENGDGQQRPSARKPIPGLVGLRVSGSWGEAGDKAHVVLCHGPPKGILDTVDTAVGTKAEPHRVEGRGIGSWRFRDKMEAVSPQVVAFGHVHANQGRAWLAWTKSKAALAWRARGRANCQRGERFGSPERGTPIRRRAVLGSDLSDTGAGFFETPEELARLHSALAHTLFLNAASLDAKQAGPEHSSGKGVPTLRPPLVARVFATRGAQARGTTKARLVPLGVSRFPEGREWAPAEDGMDDGAGPA